MSLLSPERLEHHRKEVRITGKATESIRHLRKVIGELLAHIDAQAAEIERLKKSHGSPKHPANVRIEQLRQALLAQKGNNPCWCREPIAARDWRHHYRCILARAALGETEGES